MSRAAMRAWSVQHDINMLVSSAASPDLPRLAALYACAYSTMDTAAYGSCLHQGG